MLAEIAAQGKPVDLETNRRAQAVSRFMVFLLLPEEEYIPSLEYEQDGRMWKLCFLSGSHHARMRCLEA